MSNHTIFIIDDDAGTRDSLCLLLGLHGYCTRIFSRAVDFLEAVTVETTGCALLDVRMADMGGLELQMTLTRRSIRLPVIVMTGFANIATARTAFKAGAVDFLPKPISTTELLESIGKALAEYRCGISPSDDGTTNCMERFDSLSARERDVARLLCEGLTSREVGVILDISWRTVETYKRRMMEKLNIHRLSELVRIVTIAHSAKATSQVLRT